MTTHEQHSHQKWVGRAKRAQADLRDARADLTTYRRLLKTAEKELADMTARYTNQGAEIKRLRRANNRYAVALFLAVIGLVVVL